MNRSTDLFVRDGKRDDGSLHLPSTFINTILTRTACHQESKGSLVELDSRLAQTIRSSMSVPLHDAIYLEAWCSD